MSGQSLVEVALVAPLLAMLMLGIVDFARAYYLSQEVTGAAQAAAEYGAENPSDTAGMTAAATADAPNVTGLTVSSPTYGCECSDGTDYSASCGTKPTSCTYNVVDVVQVTVSATYTPLFPWPGIPSSIALSSTAEMRSGNS